MPVVAFNILFTYFISISYYVRYQQISNKLFPPTRMRRTLCVANCGQTAAVSDMVTIETYQRPIRYHRRPSTTYRLATIQTLQTDDRWQTDGRHILPLARPYKHGRLKRHTNIDANVHQGRCNRWANFHLQRSKKRSAIVQNFRSWSGCPCGSLWLPQLVRVSVR